MWIMFQYHWVNNSYYQSQCNTGYNKELQHQQSGLYNWQVTIVTDYERFAGLLVT